MANQHVYCETRSSMFMKAEVKMDSGGFSRQANEASQRRVTRAA